MTDGAALLRTILANPADDTPRLVYADWLTENGESERGEFIRVQCELVPHFHDSFARYVELIHREQELSAEYEDSWIAQFCPPLVGRVMWGWERGFISHIRGIDWSDWLAHADAILTAQPVERVKLTIFDDDARELVLRGWQPNPSRLANPSFGFFPPPAQCRV